ncbi:MAG: hypothetical protein FRX48_05099 [Lasallia pustulata]|uniref:Uncharacterized protein n=1 Tax=Lasallia pustulata TaxID=136370 RepID=A0A5M8PMN9_9LECA|nr:MAG: hypothetical protein FRX48_05099 [Lasallia pustulata]
MPSPSRKRQDVEASLGTLTLSPSSHNPSATPLSQPPPQSLAHHLLPHAIASSPNATAPSPSASAPAPPSRRPEKSAAVAGRLIAGALGVRAPKKTEEQKAYEKAVREKEARRIRREREAKWEEEEERERARKAVWEGRGGWGERGLGDPGVQRLEGVLFVYPGAVEARFLGGRVSRRLLAVGALGELGGLMWWTGVLHAVRDSLIAPPP